jgi:hypothetical protein
MMAVTIPGGASDPDSPQPSEGVTGMFSTRTRAGRAQDEGASALEFGIVVPVLLLLLFGMIEFGLIFQGQLAVTHAAREGARLAAVQNGALFSVAAVEGRAYPLRVADGLSVSLSEPDSQSVRVTVSYPWAGRIIPFGSPMTLSSSAIMRKE